MENNESWVWADIMACSYCEHYKWVGTHAASQFCQNKKSPYYNKEDEIMGSYKPTPEQCIKGCEKLDYNNQKIPAFLFKHIPKGSQLRKLPLEQVVENFSDELDLESENTVESLTKEYEKVYNYFVEMIEKGYKKIKISKGKLTFEK